MTDVDPVTDSPRNDSEIFQKKLAERAQQGAALVLRGLLLNVLLAGLKFAGGILGNTYALIADGVESVADVFSSLMVWAGFRWAAQPPDENHPYGHGKAESVSAMAVALFILGAAIWIAVHAVHEILTPHLTPHWATLVLLAFVVTIKTWFARRMKRAGDDHGSTALEAEGWHQLTDALTSGAAFVGITIAVIGGPGYETADDWAALLACGVIAANGLKVFKRALGDVMDVAAPAGYEAQVRAVALAVAGVRGLDKCRVRKSGLGHLVDLHVEVDPLLTVRDGHAIAGAVKHALLRSSLRIGDVLVHIEPAE